MFSHSDEKIIEILERIERRLEQNSNLIQWISTHVGIIQEDVAPPPAKYIRFIWGTPFPPAPQPQLKTRNILLFSKGDSMPAQLLPGQAVAFALSLATATGAASQATLALAASNPFIVSDATLLTLVTPDPNNPTNPNSGQVTASLTPATNPDAATVTASGTATEPDGVTTEPVSGTDTVTVASQAPPPPPPPTAASIVFNWGTPFTPASAKK